MKAIIDGRRYDTDTAQDIASASGGEGRSDFNWYSEALYRTVKGKWFIAGHGNAKSHYAEPYGQNGWGPGSSIRVLSDDEAQAWLEEHHEIDALEQHFQIEDA